MKPRIEFLIVVWLIVTTAAAERERPQGWFGFAFTYHIAKVEVKGQARWLTVQEVTAGGPASKAGLQIKDMIVAISGRPISFRSDLELLEFLGAARAGDVVTFAVRRGSLTRSVKITLTAMTRAQSEAFQENLELARNQRHDK
jgi:S1-C subfamily serine protease